MKSRQKETNYSKIGSCSRIRGLILQGKFHGMVSQRIEEGKSLRTRWNHCKSGTEKEGKQSIGKIGGN